MADVNRGNRPLSPHLSIYRPQINSIMSILHRITGAGMIIAAILTVWWFLAAAAGPEAFATADDLITSWVGGFVLLGSMAMLWYHLFNGVRHLVWDAGYGLELKYVRNGSFAVFGATALMTLLTWILAY
jgi:succinate dehydrogenase / fumarate reductase cytochrome b subunit